MSSNQPAPTGEGLRTWQAGRALGLATFSSVSGGVFSLVVFLFAAPFLAKFALNFRPPEYFALAVFALSMLASISGKSSLRNLISGAFGVLIGTIGIHLTTGVERFTFGVHELSDGINFIPVLIGLFAMSELLNQSQALDIAYERMRAGVVKLPSRKDMKLVWPTILRSSCIGTFIGILPAEGSTVAAIMGYNEAKRWSKHKDEFGTGTPEGISGFFMLRHGFGLAPLVMGLTLGKLLEETFSQSMIMYDNNFLALFESPIVTVLFVLTFFSLCWPLIGSIMKRASSRRQAEGE